MAKDLTGQRFGRLTVVSLDDTPYISPGGKKTRRWLCRCDCGNEVVVLQNALTSQNGTRSCGCSRKETARKHGINLTGQRFGRLLVLGEAELEKPERNRTRRGWRCRCDCGKEVVVTRKTILSGVQSCGCLLSETARKKVVEENTLRFYDGTMIPAIRPDRPLNKNNTSGVKGVHWNKAERCWVARIGFRGKTIMLGRFKRIEDAEKARKEAEEKYYKPVLEEYYEEENSSDGSHSE